MDKLVPDNILPRMWIMFAMPPEPKEQEDPPAFIVTMMVRMPEQQPSTLVPNIYLHTPFYVQSVSLPFVTGYFIHYCLTPITYDVYKYRVYKASTQVVSLYKEDYARNFVASQNHSLRTLPRSVAFQPSWLTKTRTYKILEGILHESP